MIDLIKSSTRTLDSILDETQCPVARMRLFSEGISLNSRLFIPDEVLGDKGCLACGNCVDACPVVKEEYGFVFVQNQRTSMSLENMVGEECRRCYKCIVACPQVTKMIKEYAAAFRRGERIVHLLTAVLIISLAASGITLLHYSDFLPLLEIKLLRWSHRVLGLLLLLMPVLYLVLDKRHLVRFLGNIFFWNRTDWDWLKALMRHIGNGKKHSIPARVQFNPGQKAWYLYIVSIVFPVLGITGVVQWLGLDYGYLNPSFLSIVMLLHMIFALATDMLLFVHVYLKYLRSWALTAFDVVESFITNRHLMYPLLYDTKGFGRLGEKEVRGRRDCL